ncbi:FAD-dependent oxidoreductase [Candidatus Peregrinibacteria bacterium]|jgi:thioredoxin reductase (NADPH)|nr:FAD-dependent oxidoreductase [Candidatus Peregrinibacteria bacterium]MBT5468685.1 FAD-dependent oxidoreductase [Candidatus Peregrinibacteria bacterium]MBT7337783.1 FAD-dependent oxidoreductase [Candidatus Peregrinibacteria bacterium]
MKDVAIVGLGCAAYTAAVYTARYKLDTVLIGEVEGGMGMSAAEVGNWPGNIDISGPDLMENYKNHALSFENVEHKVGRVEKVEKTDEGFLLTMQNSDTLEARTVIFATGSNKRHLGIPGEEEFSGKGVTYCATCDAFFYRGKDVAVLGGGDSAVEGAAIAAQVANKVYLVHRKDTFRAEPYWVDKVNEKDNVEFVLNTNAIEVIGDQKVTGLKLDTPWNGSDTLNVDGVFIEIGSIPAVSLPKNIGCTLDDRGHILVDDAMKTSIQGVFAAGDVSSGSNHFAQFATAAGEGSVAANSVFNYLQAGE